MKKESAVGRSIKLRVPSFLLGVFLLAGLVVSAVAQRPNVLFVMTDDQAPWALGYSGNPQAHTPNLDAFFQSAAYLTNCFVVTPVCSPSRASLMTSRYGTEVGITDWINHHHPGEESLGLESSFISWPKLLSDSGYQTCLVGKWHLGRVPDHLPSTHGYQSFRGFLEGGTTVENPVLQIDGATQEFDGLTVDILTELALGFLDKRDKSKPFLLSVHYRSPHSPWLPVADSDAAPYESLDLAVPHPDYPDLDTEMTKSKMKEYLSSVAGVDRNFGKLMRALDALGIADNTVVVFTSDHGYNMGHNGIWHKGNGRWITNAVKDLPRGDPKLERPNLYDNSLRTPTAIRWPGVTQAGSKIERSITQLDWYPTLLAVTDTATPEGLILRGRDFSPILRNPDSDWDDNIYVQYSQHHSIETHMRAYRTTEWKLVRDFHREGNEELYHLAKDPEERTNLIGDPQYEAVRGELNQKLLASMGAIGDTVYEGKEALPSVGQ